LIKTGLTTGLNIHIYADNDKTDQQILVQLEKKPTLKPWIDSFIIHRNTYPDEKDYGVSRDRIIDSAMEYKIGN
jgi:hypothetical protein